MKLRLTLATLLLVGVLATSVCQKTETDTAQLEELPKDIAASLQRLPNSDLLVSMPPMATGTPPATQQAPPATPAVEPPEIKCDTKLRFFVQVDYPAPVTLCSSIANIDALMASYAVVSPGAKPAANVKRYRLSSFQGKPFANSIICQSRQGPWLATIIKEVDCSAKEHCEMVIGVPGSPIFRWDGQNCQTQNRPQGVQYIDPTVDGGFVGSFGCNTKNSCP